MLRWILSVAALSSAGLAAWTVDTVDSQGVLGYTSSLALDGDGRPCVAYHRDGFGVKYAWRDASGQWQREYAHQCGGSGGYTSLALDAAGSPCISYYLAWEGLCYATRTAGSWETETVAGGSWGGSTSLAIDPDGRPRVAFCEDYTGISYARRESGGWTTETVGDGTFGFCSLQLDPGGLARVACSEKDGDDWLLRYFAEGASGGWSSQTVDTTSAIHMDVSMQLDDQQYPHICYSAGDEGVRYARWTGAQWEIQTVDQFDTQAGSYATDLVLDTQDNPVIAYCDLSDYRLRCARWDGSQWVFETVDSLEVSAGYPSLEAAGDGTLHMSYYRLSGYDLLHAQREGTGVHGWQGPPGQGLEVLPAYPNPARGSITLQLRAPAGQEVGLRVYDACGRLCRERYVTAVASNTEVVLRGLPAGTYLCRAEAGGSAAGARFVVVGR
jgi:hypothetical protein